MVAAIGRILRAHHPRGRCVRDVEVHVRLETAAAVPEGWRRLRGVARCDPQAVEVLQRAARQRHVAQAVVGWWLLRGRELTQRNGHGQEEPHAGSLQHRVLGRQANTAAAAPTQ